MVSKTTDLWNGGGEAEGLTSSASATGGVYWVRIIQNIAGIRLLLPTQAWEHLRILSTKAILFLVYFITFRGFRLVFIRKRAALPKLPLKCTQGKWFPFQTCWPKQAHQQQAPCPVCPNLLSMCFQLLPKSPVCLAGTSSTSQSKQGLSSARFPPWSSFNVGLSPRAGDFHQSWGYSVFLKALNYFQLQWKLALVWKVISRGLMKMHKQSHRSAGHRCACAESETPWTHSAGLVTAI